MPAVSKERRATSILPGFFLLFLLLITAALAQSQSVAVSSRGKPLEAKVGPLRVVAPQDSRPARSVRMVTTIALRRAP